MYYSIENRTDKEVGSVFPQVSCLSQMDAHRLSSDDFPSFTPKLIFELEKKAKLTDVLSQAAISAVGLIISEKNKKIMGQCNIENTKLYPLTVKTKKGEVNYYWLHVKPINAADCINYKESTFFYTKYELRQESITINSFDHYKSLLKENGIMWGAGIDTIKLTNSFNQTIDLFHLHPFDRTIYISSKLRDMIIESRITGIEIKDAPNIS